MSSSPVSRATTTSSLAARSPPATRSSIKRHLPLPQPPPEADRRSPPRRARPQRVSISVRIRSRPLPWSSSRSLRQVPWSRTAISTSRPSRLPDTSKRAPFAGARVLDRVGRRLPARGRDLGDLQLVRAGVAEPAAQHAADRRERLRLRRELGAEALRHREVAERQERHVVRRAARRHQRREQVVAAGRAGRSGASRTRAASSRQAVVEVLARPLDQPVRVEQERVARARCGAVTSS